MALELASETVWFEKWRYDDAECKYHEQKNQASATPMLGSLANQIARAREDIQNSRAASNLLPSSIGAPADVVNRITKLEGENASLRKSVQSLETTLAQVTARLAALECSCSATAKASPPQLQKPSSQKQEQDSKANDDDDDEDVDLFGSDEEEESAEAIRVREERLKSYAEKKSKKAGPIAKSSVLLDCKPWDDETDLKVMEEHIRRIEMDGLVWGAAKQVPLAFGIHKLSILCTVEDEKVSIDDLSEKIQELEDYVQSVDVAAFNKI
ncbi:elongation factor 1-delta isoform X2 [Hyalella azteca]|uniref:Elongation factor 1-delta isoform X2 n=1 Tax=Hyalella azteca TaxID=294128 RepID=A0A8B7P2E3_HYAAZ|nr:elongation factor 1-delta isoform X2 [Hyalella azteca]